MAQTEAVVTNGITTEELRFDLLQSTKIDGAHVNFGTFSCIIDDECPRDGENDADGDSICGDVDSCPYEAMNDLDSDSVCGTVES